MSQPSRTRVDKAGDRLRKLELDPLGAMAAGYGASDEMDILRQFRQAHSLPMRSTRSLLRTTYQDVTGRQPHGAVFSRLKREEQIIAKLCRQRTRLSTIEDIGGCRAIVSTLDEAEALVERLQVHSTRAAVRMDVLSVDDYISTPQASGYRGIHLHCARDDRQVEVQIRTAGQHTWADFVETWDAAFGYDAKHANAPEHTLEGLRLYSEAIHATQTEGRTIYVQLLMERAILALNSGNPHEREGD